MFHDVVTWPFESIKGIYGDYFECPENRKLKKMNKTLL